MSFLYSLLNLVFSVFGSVLLLRAYLWSLAISPRDPLVRFAWTLTDWLVNPVATVIKPRGNWDLSTIASAMLVAALEMIVMREMMGMPYSLVGMMVTPVALLLRWAIDLVVWGLIIYCIMSFLNRGYSPYMSLLSTLCDPILRPIRRYIPTVKGFDLSPLVVIFLLNVVLMGISPASMGLVN